MEKERAILVGVKLPGEGWPLQETLTELESLAKTAGAEVVGRLTQDRDKPDVKYFIGEGKVEELAALCLPHNANLVIFDSDLHPSQERNLEAALGVKVIDRTELILDIFAQHAHSKEGGLQVELAQSNFLLTRLTGRGVLMSRLGGGIGTRGPGETKLEMDRRRIRKKISILKKELEDVRKNRTLRREVRRSTGIPIAAIVGYTNSGKSTLLNVLTRASVLVEDKLFATLDPTTRRLYLPSGQVILVTDTVGFIQKLPHELVAAFRATLEEVTEADILLHIIDASSLYFEDQIAAVYNVLEELSAITKPILTIFNKIDKLKGGRVSRELLKRFKPAVQISALHKTGFEALTSELIKLLGQLPSPEI